MTGVTSRPALVFVWIHVLILAAYPQRLPCDKSAVVNARDKQGRFVLSLQASDFRAKVHRAVVPVSSVIARRGPPRVVILLDKSGSMNGEITANALRFVSEHVIESSPAQAQFALIVFATKVLESTDFGHSRADIVHAIDRATRSAAQGPTALRDALLKASDMLGTSQLGDAVLVLSDGIDEGSKTSPGTLEQAYLTKGTRAFLLEIRDQYRGTPEEVRAEEESEALVVRTGGMARTIPRPDATRIEYATRQIEDALSNYYIVEIGPVEAAEKPVSLELELVDSSGRRRKDVDLSYPHKIVPCSSPNARP
ncbi:MAG TPA: VWA domain-containing protein [Terriglobales bacterium]